MQVSNLFNDDDAVSPVIGVILMVAITVILAAVIGAFVLNIGGSNDTAPTASWDFTNTSEGVEVSMTSGSSVDATEIYVLRGGTEVGTWNGSGSTSTINAGDVNCVRASGSPQLSNQSCSSFSAGNNLDSGTEVRLVWRSSQSDQSSILKTYTTP